MKVSLDKSGVPFVITYRKIIEKPKIVRRRKFVGTIQVIKNLLHKVISFTEDLAFETETEVVSPGKSVSVHWAVQVEDPWDVSGREANLVAFRMLDDMPPCGAHFEIISPSTTTERSDETDDHVSSDSVKESVTSGNGRGRFNRPPDPAYAPRSVSPLAAEPSSKRRPRNTDNPFMHEEDDEFAAHMDGSSSVGEDD